MKQSLLLTILSQKHPIHPPIPITAFKGNHQKQIHNKGPRMRHDTSSRLWHKYQALIHYKVFKRKHNHKQTQTLMHTDVLILILSSIETTTLLSQQCSESILKNTALHKICPTAESMLRHAKRWGTVVPTAKLHLFYITMYGDVQLLH